jgi:hypothetical protein
MKNEASTPNIFRPREAVLQKCLVRIAPRDREVGDAFRAGRRVDAILGLKPQAESFCPFGAAIDRLKLAICHWRSDVKRRYDTFAADGRS